MNPEFGMRVTAFWVASLFLLTQSTSALGQFVVDTRKADVGDGKIVQPLPSPTNVRYMSFSKLNGETQQLYIYDEIEDSVMRLAAEERRKSDWNVFELPSGEEQGAQGAFFGGFVWQPVRRFDDDRSWFAYVSNEGQKSPGVYLRSVGRGGLGPAVRLSQPGVPATNPSWSSDGRQIAFVQHSGESLDLFVVESWGSAFSGSHDGVVLHQVTSEGGRESLPNWLDVGGRSYLVYERATVAGETGIHWIDPVTGFGGPAIDEQGVWELLPKAEPSASTIAFVQVQGADRNARMELRLAGASAGPDGRLKWRAITSKVAYYVVHSISLKSDASVAWHPGGRYLSVVRRQVENSEEASAALDIVVVDTGLWRDGSAKSIIPVGNLGAGGLTFPRDVSFDPLRSGVVCAAQDGQHTVVVRLESDALTDQSDYIYEQYEKRQLITKTLIVPGMASRYLGHKKESWIIQGTMGLGVVVAALGTYKMSGASSDADDQEVAYQEADSPVAAARERAAWSSSRDDYSSGKTIFTLGVVAAVGAYVYNVLRPSVLNGGDDSGLKKLPKNQGANTRNEVGPHFGASVDPYDSTVHVGLTFSRR